MPKGFDKAGTERIDDVKQERCDEIAPTQIAWIGRRNAFAERIVPIVGIIGEIRLQ